MKVRLAEGLDPIEIKPNVRYHLDMRLDGIHVSTTLTRSDRSALVNAINDGICQARLSYPERPGRVYSWAVRTTTKDSQ